MNRHEEVILDGIRNARADNNNHWMEIVRIALTHAPVETKAVLRQIAKIDREVHERLYELATE
jgi:ribosomal protein L19E